ncbi:uncharacterized protein SCHCODRAFT_02628409 [Schizophyllum commune H4-8]|uniref:uncharacterized protein n=1 Tax=Schizophyllum commune (strain H4-8 / FGSC 9210) TaxID=578458 RepID=UPI00215EF017|nr:uncharacterized protein SCHCODRAFT_02628409 [Schizophyllum commune H4-8]KAI5891208.1 hypothetical protein SCHCODRAFT_02628409 [Schizophyllum commune H4-8]
MSDGCLPAVLGSCAVFGSSGTWCNLYLRGCRWCPSCCRTLNSENFDENIKRDMEQTRDKRISGAPETRQPQATEPLLTPPPKKSSDSESKEERARSPVNA